MAAALLTIENCCKEDFGVPRSESTPAIPCTLNSKDVSMPPSSVRKIDRNNKNPTPFFPAFLNVNR